MYDVNDYGRMMANPARMQAYTEALRRTVKASSVVLDVGTGTGIFAILAAQLGAKKVYAIDTNPCIHLARDVAQRNGCADRIEFIHGSVLDVDLPERADIVVSDVRGALPFGERSFEIIRHVRERMLAPEGVLIAQEDELFVAPIELASEHEALTRPWNVAGLDWSPCVREALSTITVDASHRVAREHQLASGARWTSIAYRSVVNETFEGEVTERAERDGVVHFLCLWFRARLVDDITYDNAPSTPEPTHKRILLPIASPVPVRAGEPIRVRLKAFPSADWYAFYWEVAANGRVERQSSDNLVVRGLQKR